MEMPIVEPHSSNSREQAVYPRMIICSPPRPSRLALRPALAFHVHRVLVGADAGAGAAEGGGVVGGAVGLAFQKRRMPLRRRKMFRRLFRKAAGGDRLFRAAHRHLVKAVLAEQRLARGLRDVAAHLVQFRLAEQRLHAIRARAHVVERGFGEVGRRGARRPLIRR